MFWLMEPASAALKRFHPSGAVAVSPRNEVVKLVSEAATLQLLEIALPNLCGDDTKADGADSGPDLVSKTSFPDPSKPSDGCDVAEKPRYAKRIANLGTMGADSDLNNTLAPTGDVRREVLNAIMTTGKKGNAIAAGTADAVQRSLQELERKRATELLLGDDDGRIPSRIETDSADVGYTSEKMTSLGLSTSPSFKNSDEDESHKKPSEEDEAMEAIRLLLMQQRVAQGHLSAVDAAKVLQHASINRAGKREEPSFDQTLVGDASDSPTIDAGDVDSRLVGCGPLPPAVLQALTLWKGGMVTNGELLELVKKDIEFVRHSVLVDSENLEKLNENSAFWGRFAFGERWAEKKARIAASSPEGTAPGWDVVGVIVKANDDLRQEAFVMQLIELCQEAFRMAGLELWVNPYRVIATGRTTGIIEMVRNAMSFDALKKRPGFGKGGLREHLQRMTEFTADPGETFRVAQRNFVRSLASYSLMSYFFLFKDRHNGNILLDTAGHVIHIDFGFVFGSAPGGSFSLEMSTPFKLTDEMLDVMGGLRSPLFSEFITLFCCGFLALQSYSDTFLTIVEIMSRESAFKCFEGRDPEEVIASLRKRFCSDLSKEETVAFALDLINKATTSYGTKQYDYFQYLSQGIAA
jgi:phosphatidylinositol 4-kinase B